MKKIIYLFTLFTTINFFGQNAFTAVEIKVNRGQGGAVAKIVDDFMKDAKFKENSWFNLERLWQGSGDFTHRFVFYGPIGDRGRAEGDMSEYENNAFWSSLRPFMQKTRAFSGRVIDWKQGNDKQSNLLVYDVIVKNPANYAKAHKNILKKLGNSEFKNRTVAFGTYDLGRPGGATHWVLLSGEGTDDLIMMHKNLQEKYTEEITEYFTNRGEVIDLRDVRIERIVQYN